MILGKTLCFNHNNLVTKLLQEGLDQTFTMHSARKTFIAFFGTNVKGKRKLLLSGQIKRFKMQSVPKIKNSDCVALSDLILEA